LLIRVEDAAAKSPLPESADREWIDEFVYTVHAREIYRKMSALSVIGGGATI
jgi:hypothetical protein